MDGCSSCPPPLLLKSPPPLRNNKKFDKTNPEHGIIANLPIVPLEHLLSIFFIETIRASAEKFSFFLSFG